MGDTAPGHGPWMRGSAGQQRASVVEQGSPQGSFVPPTNFFSRQQPAAAPVQPVAGPSKPPPLPVDLDAMSDEGPSPADTELVFDSVTQKMSLRPVSRDRQPEPAALQRKSFNQALAARPSKTFAAPIVRPPPPPSRAPPLLLAGAAKSTLMRTGGGPQTMKRPRASTAENRAVVNQPAPAHEAQSRDPTPAEPPAPAAPAAAASVGPVPARRGVEDEPDVREVAPKRRKVSKGGTFDHHAEPVYRWARGEQAHPGKDWIPNDVMAQQIIARGQWTTGLEDALKTAVRENQTLLAKLKAREEELDKIEKDKKAYLAKAVLNIRNATEALDQGLEDVESAKKDVQAQFQALNDAYGVPYHESLRQDIVNIGESLEQLYTADGKTVFADHLQQTHELKELIDSEIVRRDTALSEKDEQLTLAASSLDAMTAAVSEHEDEIHDLITSQTGIVLNLVEMAVANRKSATLRARQARLLAEAESQLESLDEQLDLSEVECEDLRDKLDDEQVAHAVTLKEAEEAEVELQQLRPLSDQITSMKDERDLAAQELATVQAQLQTASEQLAEVNDQLEKTIQARDKLRDELAEVKASLKTAEAQATSSASSLEEIKSKNEELTRADGARESQLATLKTDNAALRDRLGLLGKQHEDAQVELRMLKANANVVPPKAVEELETLRRDLAVAQKDAEGKKELKEQVDDLIEKSGQLSQQLGTAKAENVSLQNRVQQLNKEAAAVEERVKEGKTKFEAKVTDINRLERELATERGTVQTQKNHAEETTKRITDLEGKAEEANKRAAESREELARLESRNGATTTDLNKARECLDEAKTQLASACSDRDGAQAELKTRDATIRSLQEGNTRLETQLRELREAQSRTTAVEEKHAAAVEAQQELQQANNELREALEQAEAADASRVEVENSLVEEKKALLEENEGLKAELEELRKVSGKDWGRPTLLAHEQAIRRDQQKNLEAVHRKEMAAKDNELKRRDAKHTELSKRLQAVSEELNTVKSRPSLHQSDTSPSSVAVQQTQTQVDKPATSKDKSKGRISFAEPAPLRTSTQESEEIESVGGDDDEKVPSPRDRAVIAVKEAVEADIEERSDGEDATQPTEETQTQVSTRSKTNGKAARGAGGGRGAAAPKSTGSSQKKFGRKRN